MASKLPYYPLYVYDFDEDPNVLAMNLAEVGLYQLALNESWKRGSIPAEPKVLAELIRRKPAEVCKAWPKVRPCWIENCIPGRLVNPRQERERAEAETRSQRALVAANTRYSSSVQADAKKGFEQMLRGSESKSVSSPSLTQTTNSDNTSTRPRDEIFVDFETLLHRWRHHRNFRKPQKHLADRAEVRWGSVEITEGQLAAALDGYHESEWAKQQGYPIMGFVKDPHSWISKPEDEDGFAEFQVLYPGVSIPSDWDKARPIWCSLPAEDRAKAKAQIVTCDPAFVKSPRNYLKDREFMRPPRPRPKSDLEKMMEAL